MMENHGCGTGIGGRHENRGLVQFEEVAGATAAVLPEHAYEPVGFSCAAVHELEAIEDLLDLEIAD